MPEFFARPVFFVADVARAKRFYLDVLGFRLAWDKREVAQVDRGDLELILAEEPARAGNGRLFVELMPDELVAFEAEVQAGKVPGRDVVWGYRCYEIRDPDGNELLVCREID